MLMYCIWYRYSVSKVLLISIYRSPDYSPIYCSENFEIFLNLVTQWRNHIFVIKGDVNINLNVCKDKLTPSGFFIAF